VLSFGTPLLEAGPSPVRTMRGLAHMRQGRPGRRGKLVQIESRFSLTAAYADEWVFVNPGTEGALALAIGHLLGRASEWTPEKAAAITGVEAARIERLAQEFRAHKPAVALIGGLAAGHSNSLAAAEAVAGLNQLNGSYGVAGGIYFPPPAPVPRPPAPGTAKLVLAIGCNPVYAGALPKDAYLVSFSSFPDETAAIAQLVLPSPTALESWHEAAKPAVDPLYNTRDWAEVLLQAAGQTETWESVIQASYTSEEEYTAAVETGWRAPAPLSGVKKFEFGKERWAPPRFTGSGEFFLQPFESVALGNGDAANVPWLQELPDPLSQTVWDTAVEMSPRAAERLALKDGDRVTVESARGSLRGRVALSPACPPHVVGVAAGQGHTALGRYARNRGGNVLRLIDPVHWAATKVSVRKAES
jgi:anaerobic selenocysteine-containing dehydrogenase